MRVTRPAEGSTASAVTDIPSTLEPGEKMDYNETKTMYEKFGQNAKTALFLK